MQLIVGTAELKQKFLDESRMVREIPSTSPTATSTARGLAVSSRCEEDSRAGGDSRLSNLNE